MFELSIIVLILISIVLIGLVLLQPGKGDLSATFGGFSSQMGSMFGTRKTMDFLAKLTRILAVVILLVILFINKIILNQ